MAFTYRNVKGSELSYAEHDANLQEVSDLHDAAQVAKTAAEAAQAAAEAAIADPATIKSAYESNANTNAFTDAEQTKLSGIATAATANASDADLRDRTTHTGAQAIGTVTGLQSALDHINIIQALGI